jgi:hypothetical protein
MFRGTLVRSISGSGAALLVFLAASACGSSSGDSTGARGSAFGDLHPSQIAFRGKPAYAVGQQSILMYVQIQNRSGEDLRITRIEPVEEVSSSEIVDVLTVALGPRTKAGMPLGPYSTNPPSVDLRASPNDPPLCVDQPLIPSRGARLPGGDETAYVVAVHVDPTQPGVWMLDHLRVEYTQSGAAYYQDIPFRVVMPIDEAPGRPTPPDQLSCATSSTQLPGWE